MKRLFGLCALITTVLLFSCELSALTVEFFMKNQNVTGLYVSDIMSHDEFNNMYPILDDLAIMLENRSLSNGKDFFYAGDYFFYNSTTPIAENDILDCIREFKNQMFYSSVQMKESANIKNSAYMMRMKVPGLDKSRNYAAEGKSLLTKVPGESIEAMSDYVKLRSERNGLLEQMEEIKVQKQALKLNEGLFRELLKNYSSFNDLFRDMAKTREKLQNILDSQNNTGIHSKTGFHSFMEALYFNELFQPANYQISKKSRVYKKKINYEQLSKYVNIAQKKHKNDLSLQVFNRYLLLLNVAIINQMHTGSLKKIAHNPYRDLVVANTVLELESMRLRISCNFILMGVDPYNKGIFSMEFENFKGKNVRIIFDEYTGFANIENMRNVKGILDKGIEYARAELKIIDERLSPHPLHRRFVKTSFSSLKNDYNLFAGYKRLFDKEGVDSSSLEEYSSPGDFTGDSTTSYSPYCSGRIEEVHIALLYKKGEFAKNYGWIAPDDVLKKAFADVKKKNPKNWKNLNVFPDGNDLVLIGKR